MRGQSFMLEYITLSSVVKGLGNSQFAGLVVFP